MRTRTDKLPPADNQTKEVDRYSCTSDSDVAVDVYTDDEGATVDIPGVKTDSDAGDGHIEVDCDMSALPPEAREAVASIAGEMALRIAAIFEAHHRPDSV